MKYRTLPGTGISVSNLALGTMGFGTDPLSHGATVAPPLPGVSLVDDR